MGNTMLIVPFAMFWIVVGLIIVASLFAIPALISVLGFVMASGGALCDNDVSKFCMWGYGMLFSLGFWLIVLCVGAAFFAVVTVLFTTAHYLDNNKNMDSAYFRFVVRTYVNSISFKHNMLDLKHVVVAGNAVGSRQMLFSFTPKEWEGAIQNEVFMRISTDVLISVDQNYVLTYRLR
jgi:hypothetical protein